MALADFITYVTPTDTTHDQSLCEEYGVCASLIRYLPLDSSDCGGRLNADPQDPVEIRIEIQPAGSGSGTGGEKEHRKPEGVHVESTYMYWFNPSHPVNLAAAEALGYIGMPLFLRTGDSEFVVGGYDSSVEHGHADVILWQGQHLKIMTVKNWDRKLCSATLCDTLEMQEGELCMQRGDNSEREANINNDTFTSEGALQ